VTTVAREFAHYMLLSSLASTLQLVLSRKLNSSSMQFLNIKCFNINIICQITIFIKEFVLLNKILKLFYIILSHFIY
jgi:hypothetical protein